MKKSITIRNFLFLDYFLTAMTYSFYYLIVDKFQNTLFVSKSANNNRFKDFIKFHLI